MMIQELIASLADQVQPELDTSRSSRAERIYRDLRAELLLGQFSYGSRLTEEQLADRFECSRTPVREALHRLQADGHLIKHPIGGISPNPPQASAMRELYEVRVVIEDLIIRLAAADGDREVIAGLHADWLELRDCWDPRVANFDSADFVYADEAFHERLGVASGNQVAVRFLRDINERIRVLRVHDFTTTDRVGATINEHVELAESVMAGQADAAAALMRVHIDRSARVVEQRVGAMLTRMFDAEGGL